MSHKLFGHVIMAISKSKTKFPISESHIKWHVSSDLHAAVCGVQDFFSQPLDGVWSPGAHADRQVCQAALHRLNREWSLIICCHIEKNRTRHLACNREAGADLRRDGHKVTEKRRRDLSQLKHLHRRLHTHVDKQDVQHSAAMKVGDLRNRKSFIYQVCGNRPTKEEEIQQKENECNRLDSLTDIAPPHLNTGPSALVASQASFATEGFGYQKLWCHLKENNIFDQILGVFNLLVTYWLKFPSKLRPVLQERQQLYHIYHWTVNL